MIYYYIYSYDLFVMIHFVSVVCWYFMSLFAIIFFVNPFFMFQSLYTIDADHGRYGVDSSDGSDGGN